MPPISWRFTEVLSKVYGIMNTIFLKGPNIMRILTANMICHFDFLFWNNSPLVVPLKLLLSKSGVYDQMSLSLKHYKAGLYPIPNLAKLKLATCNLARLSKHKPPQDSRPVWLSQSVKGLLNKGLYWATLSSNWDWILHCLWSLPWIDYVN